MTFTCNARCVMCDSWRKPSPNELTLGEIERIFEQLPPMDAVRLTGGEPFVRPDLTAIAALVQRHLKPAFLHVTTNGFLTDRIVKFCAERPRALPLRLLVSLDGMEARHNATRGRDTAWQTATATLRALASRRREWNLHLSVNQTILDTEGAGQFHALRAFLAPLGIRPQAVLGYALSATYSTEAELEVAPRAAGEFTPFGRFQPHELRELLDLLETDARDLPAPERLAKQYYSRGLRARLLEGRPEPRPPCVALRSHLRLLPNGDVPTCQFNSRRVGNLRRQTFAEVWHGTAARAQRDWVRACPGCWAECEVLPNAFYSADLFIRRFRRPPAPAATAVGT